MGLIFLFIKRLKNIFKIILFILFYSCVHYKLLIYTKKINQNILFIIFNSDSHSLTTFKNKYSYLMKENKKSELKKQII